MAPLPPPPSRSTAFRNSFHLHPLVSTDIFVPCGGRPEAVNIRNVHLMFNKDGSLKFKVPVNFPLSVLRGGVRGSDGIDRFPS
jgi:hypothetical protein